MDNLLSLRKEKGISQQKLADEIESTQQNIHRYENGYYEPDIYTLKQLANYFETSIDYLVGNTDIRRKIEEVHPYDLNEEEAALIEQYRSLRPDARKAALSMIDNLRELTK